MLFFELPTIRSNFSSCFYHFSCFPPSGKAKHWEYLRKSKPLSLFRGVQKNIGASFRNGSIPHTDFLLGGYVGRIGFRLG